MTPDKTNKPTPNPDDEEYEVEIVATDPPADETQSIKKEGDPIGDNFA